MGSKRKEIQEEGHKINPHIPSCMSSAPWYIGIGQVQVKIVEL